MTQRVSDWLDSERIQTGAGQRSRIETTKLLATFSAALAGAVTATALQVGSPNGLDVAAAVLLALTALGAVIVILLDRTRDVAVDRVLRDATVQGWNQDQLFTALRQASYAALDFNESVVGATKTAAALTAGAAFLDGTIAALSLLQSAT